MKARSRVVLIAGPTASGKSALATRLAERFGGAVVNADSMQCYRDLRILTARPSAEDEERVDHLLYGTVDGSTNHSVSRWLGEAETAIEGLWAASRIPIVVGGTGLYLKALVEGLSTIPDVPEGIRAEVRAWANGRPPADIHRQLQRLDPFMAGRLRPTDPQRLIRAYEVIVATGRSLATFQAQRAVPLLSRAEVLAVTLSKDGERLGLDVGERVDRMLANGAIGEVSALLARKLSSDRPAMRAIGVRDIAAYLDGLDTLQGVADKMKAETKAYIKRQRTFFRTQLGFPSSGEGDAEAELSARLQSA